MALHQKNPNQFLHDVVFVQRVRRLVQAEARQEEQELQLQHGETLKLDQQDRSADLLRLIQDRRGADKQKHGSYAQAISKK